MERKDIIKDLKIFLQTNYPNYQAFNCCDVMGDEKEEVYNKNGIIVLSCKNWNYIEIYGLTNKEYDSLIDKDNWYTLKTFRI